MRVKGYISVIMGLIPNAVDYKVVRPKKSHYMIVDRFGNKYYLILTSRVLKYPPSIGINYEGEMFGINRRDLYEVQRDGNYVMIIWGIKHEDKVYVYGAKVRDVVDYAGMFRYYRSSTCRRVGGSDEVVCHYPIALCNFLGVVGGRTITEYLRGKGNA